MAGVGLRTKKSERPTAGALTGAFRRLRPGWRFAIGRQLAFALSDESLQMAAAWHAGPTVRLLDVRKVYFTGTPPDSSESRRQKIKKEIDRYVGEFGGRQPTIAVTVTGQETALRLVTLPKLRGAELASALAFETRRQIPFPVDDCWISHRIVEESAQTNNRLARVAVLVATKAAVDRQLAPFDDLGLTVDYVYHTQDVVGRLLSALSDFDSNRDYMLVDIHSRRTEISYYRGSELQFLHISSLGSSFLANRADPTVFEYFAESLATELQNSLDYYGGQYQGQSAQEVYICGDLAYTTELIALLADRVGFTFRRFPAERLNLTRDRDASFESDISVCLPAVAAATNQARIADLLPYPRKVKRRRRRADRIGIAALMLLAVVAVSQWLLYKSGMAADRETLSHLQSHLIEIKSSDLFATYNRVKARMAANQAYLAGTKGVESYLSLNLKELSLLVPAGIQLENFNYTADAPERNLTLTGVVATGSIPPELALAELVENLNASPFYADVQVDRHVKRRRNDQFVLDFSLSMRAAI